jgi:chitodextrinase
MSEPFSHTTLPTTGPDVTVNEVGSNYAALSWTPPQDDGPHFTYEIWANGSLRATTGRDITSIILRSLAPATSYSITVRGRDEGYHWSPFSDPVSITTQPANPDDDTAPTTPAFVSAYGFGDDSTEMQIQWAQSTDDFDVQSNIRYDVYVNGVLEEVRFGSSGPVIAYGQFGENTVEVFATDTSGSRSAPATTTISF